jgi:hypothetical protein
MEPQATSRYRLKPEAVTRGALLAGVGALGVVMVHHPMIFSGFRRIQTAWMDTRLIHYLLEYGYRSLWSEPGRWEFWNPPFFYPATNVMAYSDTLLCVGPVYWFWRTLGASPDLSFGLWMLSISALNYAAGILLFRRGLRFGVLAAAAGASLVAFGAPRVNQMDRQQLLPCFYVLLTVPLRAAALGRWFGVTGLPCVVVACDNIPRSPASALGDAVPGLRIAGIERAAALASAGRALATGALDRVAVLDAVL